MLATIRRAAMPIRLAVSAVVGLAAFFVSAASSVVVALPPVVGIVREAGAPASVSVLSLISAGGDPHSFEPSARDIRAVADASLYCSIGFPFEDRLLARVRALRPDLRVVALTNGCALRPGDPHLWLSISNRAVLVRNAARALGLPPPAAGLPLLATGHESQATRHPPSAVVSCHPSWDYLAADLGVTVIDLEREGREPTARSLAADLARAKALGVRTVISEPQFSRRTAERFAAELGARVVVLDPLAVDSRLSVSNFIEAVRE